MRRPVCVSVPNTHSSHRGRPCSSRHSPGSFAEPEEESRLCVCTLCVCACVFCLFAWAQKQIQRHPHTFLCWATGENQGRFHQKNQSYVDPFDIFVGQLEQWFNKASFTFTLHCSPPALMSYLCFLLKLYISASRLFLLMLRIMPSIQDSRHCCCPWPWQSTSFHI